MHSVSSSLPCFSQQHEIRIKSFIVIVNTKKMTEKPCPAISSSVLCCEILHIVIFGSGGVSYLVITFF
jgi:hypothetical protein